MSWHDLLFMNITTWLFHVGSLLAIRRDIAAEIYTLGITPDTPYAPGTVLRAAHFGRATGFACNCTGGPWIVSIILRRGGAFSAVSAVSAVIAFDDVPLV
jgi:hypothetical protein